MSVMGQAMEVMTDMERIANRPYLLVHMTENGQSVEAYSSMIDRGMAAKEIVNDESFDETEDEIFYIDLADMDIYGPSLDDLKEEPLCMVCGLPFTPEEWENRHTDPDDEMSDIHEACCKKCNKEPK